ncbi:MAG: hypothetical protein AVO39_01585 [delta proteobacterium MLS_D]|nr:MAG: hypothetical protein AVO39_01585 [delta proteobacterium MLS_D]
MERPGQSTRSVEFRRKKTLCVNLALGLAMEETAESVFFEHYELIRPARSNEAGAPAAGRTSFFLFRL